ncbi:MAG: DUF5763 domain-containing protein [Chloroflexota bacterium]
MTTTRKCKATRRDGQPCNGWAGESGYCFTHDPARAKERATARAKGGKARHGRTIGQTGSAEPVRVQAMADVVNLLEQTVNDVLGLENSLQRARTIATLANVIVKALEFATLAERVEALEQALKARDN